MFLITSLAFAFLAGNVPFSVETMAGLPTGPELTSIDYFDSEEYLVNPGDEIWISFPGGLPFSGANEAVSIVFLPIALDGVLNIPTMPPIATDGMSLQVLQDRIEGFFLSSYRGMIISAGLSRSASFEVPVTGHLQEPGIVVVNGLTRLTEALELAGGVASTGAIANVIVVSTSGDSMTFNLNNFLLNGDMSSNPLMKRNTRIHVSSVEASIIIEGALAIESDQRNFPSQMILELSTRLIVEFIPEENAREAIKRVGGVSSRADINGCFIQRLNSDSVHINIPFSLQGENSSVLVLSGDRLIVPSSSDYINVTGEVISKNPVPYSPGMTVNFYIGMAGGFNSVARRNSVQLILIDGEKHDIELTDIVPPGSTIDVPRVPVKFWEEYLTILTGVATVVIAYQSIFQ